MAETPTAHKWDSQRFYNDYTAAAAAAATAALSGLDLFLPFIGANSGVEVRALVAVAATVTVAVVQLASTIG